MNKPIVTMIDTEQKRPVPLEAGNQNWLLGRGEGCQLQFPTDVAHRDVSRYHAQVRVDAGGVWIRDLGSLNGTYVNGVRIGKPRKVLTRKPASSGDEQHPLADGDEVVLGLHTVLKVRIRDGEEQGPVI